MSEIWLLAQPVFCGGTLGVLFFGGLWWTVSQGIPSHVPGLWFLGSLMLRMGVVLAGFYWVGHGHWDRLLLCLIGFILARIIVTRLTERSLEISNEATHATDLR